MQHRDQETQQPVANMAYSLAMPLALGSQRLRHHTAMALTLRGDSRHMIKSMAQARVTTAPHPDWSALATVLGDRGDPTLRAHDLLMPFAQSLGGFGKQPGGDLATDPGQGLHKRPSGWPPSLVRFLSPGGQDGLNRLGTTAQLLSEYPQTREQELTMGLSRRQDTRRRWEGRRLSAHHDLLSRDPPNAMRGEHVAYLLIGHQGSLGGRRSACDKVPQPRLISRRAQVKHWWIKAMPWLSQPIRGTTECCE
jgi:hypothetical protein